MHVDKCYQNFNGTKVKNASTIWLSEYWAKDGEIEKVNFANQFGYCFAQSESHHKLKFDEQDTITLSAELYGGFGRGGNGGGVRCGNCMGVQIKGIGANLLVGAESDLLRTNGIYSIHESIREIIFSELGNQLLPHGVVVPLGLIYLGKSSNPKLERNLELPLTLLVRQKSIRPAHFLPVDNFRPLLRNNFRYKNEGNRLEKCIHDLLEQFENIDELSEYVTRTLEQFAYASVVGFAHGAVSPSNISIDGRWLDLTNANFDYSQNTYCAASDTVGAKYEIQAAQKIIEEFEWQIGKYSDGQVTSQKNISKISERSLLQMLRGALFILGIRVEGSAEIEALCSCNEIFFEVLDKLLSSSGSKEDEARIINDFYNCLVQDDFRHLRDSIFGESKIISKYDNLNESVEVCYLRALRLHFLKTEFSNEKINNLILDFLNGENFDCNLSKTPVFIDNFKFLTKVMLGNYDIARRTYIFAGENIRVYYDLNTDEFCVDSNDSLQRLSLRKFLGYLPENNENFYINSVDLTNKIFEMISSLSRFIERGR